MNMPLADEIRAIFQRGRDEEKKKKEKREKRKERKDEYSTEDETTILPSAISPKNTGRKGPAPQRRNECPLRPSV